MLERSRSGEGGADMSGLCEGRVVVITGAGRGIGRAHALEFARQGADVVVNDLGAEADGTGASIGPAGEVADEVRALGRRALLNGDDVADEAGAERLIAAAIEEFGRIDVLVNNAGILRDRMLVNMTYAEWDDVIRVHLRGTFGPSHFAANHWRDRSKAGEDVDARIINTVSSAGLQGQASQSNYGAAKAGIAAFVVIAAMELQRYGVTVNAIAPAALTRMTENLGGAFQQTEEQRAQMDPQWVANVVTWLASPESKDLNGRVVETSGLRTAIAEGWRRGPNSDTPPDSAAAVGAVLLPLLADAAKPTSMLGI